MLGNTIRRFGALLFWGIGALYIGARAMLNFIGYTTAFDDAELLQRRLPGWLSWIFSTPWWVPTVLMVALTAFVVWACWPRRTVRILKPEEAAAEGISLPLPATQFANRSAIRLHYREDHTPELLSQENIFRYYSLSTEIISIQPDGTEKPFMVSVLFLVYDCPVRHGNIRIGFRGQLFKYETKDFGSRHAIIWFSDILRNVTVEVETY